MLRHSTAKKSFNKFWISYRITSLVATRITMYFCEKYKDYFYFYPCSFIFGAVKIICCEKIYYKATEGFDLNHFVIFIYYLIGTF